MLNIEYSVSDIAVVFLVLNVFLTFVNVFCTQSPESCLLFLLCSFPPPRKMLLSGLATLNCRRVNKLMCVFQCLTMDCPV